MNGWPAERAESYAFMGDCYGAIGEEDKQVEAYFKAFHTEPTRRVGLLRLAGFYRHKAMASGRPQDHQGLWRACLACCAGAMEIPWHGGFYAENKAEYENIPWEHAYIASGWLGQLDQARRYLLKALEFRPYSPEYLRDSQYYFEYGDSGIEGWLFYPEALWLYERAKEMKTIVEIGSWCGRSTHALLTGSQKNGGVVTAVDHWQGSPDPRDGTHSMVKEMNVWEEFQRNVGHFNNLRIVKKDSIEAARELADETFEMVWIDAGHDYASVMADLEAWQPKCTKLLCGHDFQWDTVRKAVTDKLGPVETHETIWFKWMDR